MPGITDDRRDTWVRRDDGYVIAVVMGIIALLTVVTAGGFAVARQSLHESELNRRESAAFQAANGAVDVALARIRLSGYRATDFPMSFTRAQLGSGAASVTASQPNPNQNEYLLVSSGKGDDGSAETVRTRIYVMDLYGMNIAYGSGFNQNTGGKFNGNASVYGPFYTYDDLRQGDNLGNAASGGFGWGPIYIKGGTLDVKSGYLVNVGLLYVDAEQPDPKIVASSTRVIRSVPELVVPRVDATYLAGAYAQASEQSMDNKQGDPRQRLVPNSEPVPYPAVLAPGAGVNRYKIIDNDTTVNGSYSAGLTIGTGVSFGREDGWNGSASKGDDFAWNSSTRELTVWGTVFIDGPLNISGGDIRYVGNGALIANGPVRIVNCNLTPVGGLLPGLREDGVVYNNQRFDPGKTLGIATPRTISMQSSTTNNDKNPDGPPTHAGAFFADERIIFESKTVVVGSLISRGIDILGNNNMDLRTSPNLGECVPRSMPGYGNKFVSVGIWARQ